MRKLFYLLFLLPFIGLAQNATITSTGTTTSVTKFNGGVWADRILKTPVVDTTALFPNIANLGRILTFGNRLYHHNGTYYKRLAYTSDLTIANLQSVMSAGSTATVSTDISLTHGAGATFSNMSLTDGFAGMSAVDNDFTMNGTTASITSPLFVGAPTEGGHAARLSDVEAASTLQEVLTNGADYTGSAEILIYPEAFTLFANSNATIQATDNVNISSYDGAVAISGNGTNAAQLKTENLTADRNIQFPDNSGTIALLSDITGGGTVTSVTGTDGITVANGTTTPVIGFAPSDIQFTPVTAPTYSEGLFFYDTDAHTFVGYDDISGTSLNMGYEVDLKARNSTGVTITNGSVVYVSGATGQTPNITLARADAMATSSVIGVVTADIVNNTIGKVTIIGEVNGLNTSAFSDGATVYLSATTAGALTATPPSSPNYLVKIGTINYSNTTLGKLAVHVDAPLAKNTALTDANIPPTAGAVKTYADTKAPIDSPTFTGTVTAPIITNPGAMTIGTTTSTQLNFQTNGATRWQITSSGSWQPAVNNAQSMGTTGNRASNVFSVLGNFSGQVTIPATPVASTDAASKGYVDGLAAGFATNATTVGLSSATLNSTYPNVPVGYRVICGNITMGGAIYTKYSEAGSSDVWLMCSAPVQP